MLSSLLYAGLDRSFLRELGLKLSSMKTNFRRSRAICAMLGTSPIGAALLGESPIDAALLGEAWMEALLGEAWMAA